MVPGSRCGAERRIGYGGLLPDSHRMPGRPEIVTRATKINRWGKAMPRYDNVLYHR